MRRWTRKINTFSHGQVIAMRCRTMVSLALLLTLACSATSLADRVTLRNQAETTGQAVTLADVAHLEGDQAQRLADVVVAQLEGQNAQGDEPFTRIDVTLKQVREAVDKHEVNWALVTLGGFQKCRVTLKPRQDEFATASGHAVEQGSDHAHVQNRPVVSAPRMMGSASVHDRSSSQGAWQGPAALAALSIDDDGRSSSVNGHAPGPGAENRSHADASVAMQSNGSAGDASGVSDSSTTIAADGSGAMVQSLAAQRRTLRMIVERMLRDELGAQGHKLAFSFPDADRELLSRWFNPQEIELELTAKAAGGRVPMIVRMMRGRDQIDARRMIVDVQRQVMAAVLTNMVRRGQTIRPGDFQIKPIVINDMRQIPLSDPQAILGQMAATLLRKDEPIYAQHLRGQLLVRRGEIVTVEASSGGITLKTVARAAEDGARGEMIEVYAPDNRRQRYTCVVSGIRQVTAVNTHRRSQRDAQQHGDSQSQQSSAQHSDLQQSRTQQSRAPHPLMQQSGVQQFNAQQSNAQQSRTQQLTSQRSLGQHSQSRQSPLNDERQG